MKDNSDINWKRLLVNSVFFNIVTFFLILYLYYWQPILLSKEQRYLIFADELVSVHEQPDYSANITVQIRGPSEVQIFGRLDGYWALIGKNGKQLGFVPRTLIRPISE